MVLSAMNISEFAIDPGDFLTQTASAVAAGLVVLLVQPQWMGKGVTSGVSATSASSASVKQSGSGNHNAHGSQAVIGKKARVGDIHQSMSSSTTTNIYGSKSDASANEDAIGKAVAVGFVVLLGVVLLASYWPLIASFVVGAGVALGVMNVVGGRAQRRSTHWPSNATWTLMSTGLAIAASVAAMVLAVTTRIATGSIADLRQQAVDAVIADRGQPTVLATVSETWGLLFSLGAPGVAGVALIAIGVGLALVCLLFSWSSTLDWLSHLRSTAGATGTRTRARGERFATTTAPRIFIPVAGSATFAILLTLGIGSSLLDLVIQP